MDRLPEGSTVPMPLSMVTPVAFDDFQESVADCPCSIAEGDALSVIIGSGAGGASGGAGASGAEGVGCGAFFAHPTPEMSNASRMDVSKAGTYLDLLIGGISFDISGIPKKSVLIIALSDAEKHPIELEYITRMKPMK